MPFTVKLKYLRIAPRKVRLISDLIRGKSAEEAQNILSFTTKRATLPLLKLLKSAIVNAKNNFQVEESNLYISKILVDEGPKYKRWMPRARGQASEIQKKTSHIIIVLDEIVKKPKKSQKIKKSEKVSEIKKEIKEEIKKDIVSKEDFKISAEQAKPKPKLEIIKPKGEKGIRRIFRRKVF